MFSEGVEMEKWTKMGYAFQFLKHSDINTTQWYQNEVLKNISKVCFSNFSSWKFYLKYLLRDKFDYEY